MHRPILLLALSLSLASACASGVQGRHDVQDSSVPVPMGGRVALDVEGTALADVVASIAQQAAIHIEVNPGLGGPVTLAHGTVPWDFSLRWVAAQVGARVVLRPGGARLVPSELPQVEVEGRRCGELVGGPSR